MIGCVSSLIPRLNYGRTLFAMACAHLPDVPAVKRSAPNSSQQGRPQNDLLLWIAKELGQDWRRLAIHLGLSQANVDDIDGQPHKSQKDKSFQMLTSWTRKLRNDKNGYEILITMLESCDRNDIAEMVENYDRNHNPPSPNPDNPDYLPAKMRQILKDKYGEHRFVFCSSVDEKRFEFSELFTSLELTKTAVVSTRLNVHTELLDLRNADGDAYKRILLRGPKGCGKTVLLKAVSQDWSKQNDNPRSLASNYDLLFTIDLREVSEEEDLADAVFAQLLPEDVRLSRDSLRSYMDDKEKQSRVAILLDGLDQLICCGNRLSSKTVPEYFYKMITKKVHRESLVIVASRTLTKKLPDAYQIIDVGGFSRENVATYVSKFFRDNKEKMLFLQNVLESYSSDLTDFSTYPSVISALCELLQSAGTEAFPKGLTEIYDHIFKDMVRQYKSSICIHGNGPISYFFKSLLKSVDYADLFPKFHNPVPVRGEQLEKFFYDIGRVALQGLLCTRENRDFEEFDFGRDALAIACSVGILVKDDEKSVAVRFCHPSVQEYCASKYCQSLATSKPTKFRKKLGRFGDQINLYRFCCGNSKESSDLIMKFIIPPLAQGRVTLGTSLEGRIALACLAEFHSDSFLQHLEPCLTADGSIKVEYSSVGSWLLRVLCDVLNTACRSDTFRLSLQTVRTLNVTCGMSTQCISSINTIVGHLSNLQTVVLVNNSDQIPSWLATTPNGDAVCELVSHLRNHHLSKLTIVNCGLGSRCVSHILSQLPYLEFLDLSNNPRIIWSKLREPARYPKLTTLKLKQCGITEDEAKSFVEFLQQQSDLTELSVDWNDLETTGLAIIMDAVCDLGKLQLVSAERKRSDGMSLPHEETVRMLRRCSALKACNVSKWKPKDEEAGAEMLEAASHLDDFQALIFDERSFMVDEFGNVVSSPNEASDPNDDVGNEASSSNERSDTSGMLDEKPYSCTDTLLGFSPHRKKSYSQQHST
ncbi:uncharacterized protein LOC110975265 [Acanthaster planci]|uniref:Uncharacterized protein LOC110975265 n=1 Tax=Acanthaster planci TaxID=133434 RepID=A0A8B7XSV1_ACAPL|nr:uncharacterized protein LOC110975265 [Acanthaster planci]